MWKSLCHLALVAGLAVPAFALELGDTPEPFELKEWVHGDEITLEAAKGNNVLVVQFFATWDSTSMERLSDMEAIQKDFADKGVVVVSIANEKPDALRTWMEGLGAPLTMRVAADDSRNTQGTWFEGPERLPHCYVIDKAGSVAWQGPAGHDELRETVEQVSSGDFDAGAAKAVKEAREAVTSALGKQDLPALCKGLIQLIDADPEVSDFDQFLPFIAGRIEDPAPWFELCRAIDEKVEDANRRNGAAWALVTTAEQSRDPVLAVKLAKPAVESAEAIEKGGIVDTIARAYYVAGQLSKAIQEQKRAIELQKAAIKGADAEQKDGAESAMEGLKETLAYYERMAAAAKALK